MTVRISVVGENSTSSLPGRATAGAGKLQMAGAGASARYLVSLEGPGGRVWVKRVGKNLQFFDEPQSAGQPVAVIQDFFGSDAVLLVESADAGPLAYVAVDAAALAGLGMGEDATLQADGRLLSPQDASMAEGPSPLLGTALSGLAALAGGVAINAGRQGGGAGQVTPVARAIAGDADATDRAGKREIDTERAADDVLAENTGQPLLDTSAEHDVPAIPVDAAVDGALAGEPSSDGKANAATADGPAVAADANGAERMAPATRATAADEPAAGTEAGERAGAVPASSPQAAPEHVAISTPHIAAVVDDQGAVKGVIASEGHTDDGYPEVTGKADPGVLVHLYDGVELIGRILVGASGEWSYIPRSPMSDGRHELSILHEYPNGDASDFSEAYVIHVDKSTPDVPWITGVLDDEGRITGQVGAGSVTDDNTPTVTGTAEPNASIIVYDKGREIGRAQVDGDGNWSFTPDVPLNDGLHIFSYAAVDRAGNQGEQSGTFEFVVDTRPERVRIYGAEDDVGTLTGSVASGGITDDAMPTLYGTATAGGIVKVYEGAVLLGQTVAGVDGAWEFTPDVALTDGVHALQATVTLEAKGESARTAPFTLTIDTTAPARPTLDAVLDDQGSVVGHLVSGDSTDDAEPTLSGTAEPNSTVIIRDNGVEIGRAPVGADGFWTFQPSPALVLGPHVFTVEAVDAAGNTSMPTDGFVLTVEDFVLDAPLIVSVHDDVGAEQGVMSAGTVTDDTQPMFVGTSTPHTLVVLKDNGVEIGRVPVDAQGGWSYTPTTPLSDGVHNVTATALTTAGTPGGVSNSFDFRILSGGPGGEGLSAAGFENFTALTWTETAVALPSGVVLTGNYDVNFHNLEGIHDESHDVDIADRGQYLVARPGLNLELPDPARYVSFYIVNRGTNRPDMSFLNADGEVIGNVQWRETSLIMRGYELFSFTAPAGEAIASIRFDTGSVSLDALRWGDGMARSVTIDHLHVDGSGAELLQGKIDVADVNAKVQVSVDGGQSWADAVVHRDRWMFTQKQAVSGSWEAMVRIVDKLSGLPVGVTSSVLVDGPSVGAPPTILAVRTPNDLLGSAEAREGVDVVVSLAGTHAKAGDSIYLAWGITSQLRVLSALDVQRGEVDVKVSSWATTKQGYRYDFEVTAAIVSQDHAGSFSQPYKVVAGGFSTRTVADTLDVAKNYLADGSYQGTDFVIRAANGVLSKTASTSAALAGLTVNAGSAAAARLEFDKPLTKFSLRLSGLDNSSGGAVVVVYDVSGAEMYRESVRGTLTSGRYIKTVSYSAPAGKDVGAIEVVSATGQITLDQFSQTQALHVADTRDTQLIQYSWESFYGGSGDDHVTLKVDKTNPDETPVHSNGLHGGAGIDTLKFVSLLQQPAGSITTLDLSDISGYREGMDSLVTGFEIFSLAGSGDQTLRLAVKDVLNNGQVDLFTDSARDNVQMMVRGDSGDHVFLLDQLTRSDHGYGEWVKGENHVIEGKTYESYQHTAFHAEVFVSVEMGVTLHG